MKRPALLKRAKPGVQAETISKVAAKVAAAESATTHEYDMRQVALANIRLWEDQPRSFHLTMDDIIRGQIQPDDPASDEKTEELESIIALALSLKEFGMLNAPIAYAMPGKTVQLMGGQRRTMAAVFALFHVQSKVDAHDHMEHDVVIDDTPDVDRLQDERIAVKVFAKKPDDLTLERLGMVDNVQRTELPIADKLRWVVKYADKRQAAGRELGWRDLVDTLGLSRSQAYEWLAVVQARQDPWVRKLMEKVGEGEAPFSRLLQIARAEPNDREALFELWYGTRPAPDRSKKVSLGVTTNLPALKSLVLANVHGDIKDRLATMDWGNPRTAKKAFAEFLAHWEANHG